MSRDRLTGLWQKSITWRPSLGADRIQRQQYEAADSTELRKLASSSSGLTQDTSYRPHSPTFTHASEAAPSETDKSSRIVQTATRYRSGWRFGAINCAIWASIVFLINLTVTIWGSVHNKTSGSILFEGDCERVRKLNTGLHFLINLLSTVLLSSSNYSMQCLSAPTRKEIDDAHAKRIWLDIGVPSIR